MAICQFVYLPDSHRLGTIAHGQIPLLSDGNSIESGLPPADVVRYGALEVTWVQSPVSGENLFQIAAPTVEIEVI